jgi:hypothetical protein
MDQASSAPKQSSRQKIVRWAIGLAAAVAVMAPAALGSAEVPAQPDLPVFEATPPTIFEPDPDDLGSRTWIPEDPADPADPQNPADPADLQDPEPEEDPAAPVEVQTETATNEVPQQLAYTGDDGDLAILGGGILAAGAAAIAGAALVKRRQLEQS